jgi:two-component SAPR family response regulator
MGRKKPKKIKNNIKRKQPKKIKNNIKRKQPSITPDVRQKGDLIQTCHIKLTINKNENHQRTWGSRLAEGYLIRTIDLEIGKSRFIVHKPSNSDDG